MDQQLVSASSKQKGSITSFFSVRKTLPCFSRKILTLPQNFNGDTGPLQLNAKTADESTLKKAIKYGGNSDAKRAKLEKEIEKLAKENTELDEDKERLLRDKAALETQATVLKDTITKLRDELEESERIRDTQTEELKQFQTQEYEKTRGVARESHEAISSQFQEIFRQCAGWARDYFNIKIVDFDISKFPGFGKELEEVSWDNSDWGSKKLFKASHLVQAVLGNMICDRIFFSPFYGTPIDFYRQFQDMYEMKCHSMSSSSSPVAHTNKCS